MQYAHKSSLSFFTESWIFYHQSHDKARVVAAMFPQRSSTTNFALPGINTPVKMWIHFCSCCSVTAVKNKRRYWFSWNASCRASIKARLFYQFTYFEQRVYFLCNPPWGTPVAEQNHCRNVCFLLCKCNFCSPPSAFGPTSVSSLYVLLLNLREVCFMKKTWICVFKAFLALDKNGCFVRDQLHLTVKVSWN